MPFGKNDYIEDAEKFASLTGLFLGSDEVEVFRHAYHLSGYSEEGERLLGGVITCAHYYNENRNIDFFKSFFKVYEVMYLFETGQELKAMAKELEDNYATIDKILKERDTDRYPEAERLTHETRALEKCIKGEWKRLAEFCSDLAKCKEIASKVR